MPLTSLIGLPGSGKSTVGRTIARRLGMRFVDTDAEIERRAGKAVRDIFEAAGEVAFRDLEAAVVADLVCGTNAVIATGGGTVLRPANRLALNTATTVVYLRCRPDTLFRRLRNDKRRPLLQVNDPLVKLRELFSERDPLYRETAHFVIECERPTVTMLANTVMMQLELAGFANSDRASPRADLPNDDQS